MFIPVYAKKIIQLQKHHWQPLHLERIIFFIMIDGKTYLSK